MDLNLTWNICLTFCLGKFTLSLCSSWWTSPMLKVPSPFLSASENVCCNHVRLQLRKKLQGYGCANLNYIYIKVCSDFFLGLKIGHLQINMHKRKWIKDIDHGCVASGPNCPHHWYQPWGISAQWPRCGPRLRWWIPDPGTSHAPHSKYWSSSLGQSGCLRNAWRSLTFSPRWFHGWNQ